MTHMLKLAAASLIAFALASGAQIAAAATDAAGDRTVFDQLSDSAPRSPFADLAQSAPRSVFDDIRDASPNAATLGSTIRDNAP